MKITRTSMISGTVRTREVDVTEEQMNNYYEKCMSLQDAFPHLSEEDREFIKTGIFQDEWEDMTSD